MADARPSNAAPSVTRREDYRPPDWRVPEISLVFELGPERTVIRSTLTIEREGNHQAPLRLDADGLDIHSLAVDGEAVNYRYEHEVLEVPVQGESARVETVVA